MLFIAIISLQFLTVLGLDGDKTLVRDTRIINGHRTYITTHPYQVILYVDKKFECSGSIVSEYWVLSAAHCTNGLANPYQLVLRAGSSNRFRGGYLYRAVQIVMHPKFDPSLFNNDFALIRVKRAFNFKKINMKPINIADVEPVPRSHLLVSGWGTTGWGDLQEVGNISPFYATYLMEVDVFVVEKKSCARNYFYVNNITESMLCARGPASDACAKDSGGPLVDPRKNVLVGIVSWGAGCAYNLYPGIYSNVAYAKPWIDSVIG